MKGLTIVAMLLSAVNLTLAVIDKDISCACGWIVALVWQLIYLGNKN